MPFGKKKVAGLIPSISSSMGTGVAGVVMRAVVVAGVVLAGVVVAGVVVTTGPEVTPSRYDI